SRMLWSMAGNMAMVHRVFMGMQFEKDGIKFQPVIPKQYGGTKTLNNFPYRDAILNIEVTGYGNEIKKITLDGRPLKNAFFDASLSGEHKIEIEMANNEFAGAGANFVENKFSLSTPQARLENGIFSWKPLEGAQKYLVYKNGEIIEETTKDEISVSPSGFAEFKVSAIGPNGFESFTSEPIWSYDASAAKQLEMEEFAQKSSEDIVNYSGNGFVEISTKKNRLISITVNVEKAGKYLIDFRYSNGSGPWNTDNKAGIRSLYANGEYEGAVVYPQRGKDEWSDWGYSNSFTVELQKGENLMQLKFEDWNNNMNVEVNRAMLDFMRLIPLED
ncbi:MAG: hypothetical protein WBL21_11600, partial [Salinimicrobium sp.]